MTFTGPAASAGATAVICMAELTVKLVAATAPNWTAVAPVRLTPVIVTVVPPVVGPELGLTPETVGKAVSMVRLSGAEANDTLLAASVAVAVMLYTPSISFARSLPAPPTVKDQFPEPSATACPRKCHWRSTERCCWARPCRSRSAC